LRRINADSSHFFLQLCDVNRAVTLPTVVWCEQCSHTSYSCVMWTVQSHILQLCDMNSAVTHPTHFQSDITTITIRWTPYTMW